jgi:hypothetical protein
MWDTIECLEGDDNKDLRKRLDAAADQVYQHEADEWSESMQAILATTPQPMIGFSFMPKGEVK